MTVWIVLVNYNGWADTRKCLASLREVRTFAPGIDVQVVLVDNASRENLLAEIEANDPWCHTIRNPVNAGWAGGNNTGIRHALAHNAAQIILLNNDTTVAPNLIEALVQAAGQNPEYGVLGPVICYMDNPEQVQTDGCLFNPPSYNGFFRRKPVELGNQPAVTEVEIVNGCCMMISARAVRTIGLIDEQFFLIHEESDYNLRARQAGFKCGVLNEALVWHKGSSTFKATGSKIQRYYDARNLLRLLDKHADQHPTGRSWFRSMPAYAKYVYYRYCQECEQGDRDSAEAVVEGVYDGLAGRYGAMEKNNRWGIGLLRRMFEMMRWVRSRKTAPGGI